MNKQLLLQSIKTVSGFLAVLSIGFLVLGFILSNVPIWAGVALSVIGLAGCLVWLEYRNLKDKAAYQRLKDGIK